MNALPNEREVVLTELAGIKQDRPSPRQAPKQVVFSLARMKTMRPDPSLGYGKQLLRFLVQHIQVEIGQVKLGGSVGQLEVFNAFLPHRKTSTENK